MKKTILIVTAPFLLVDACSSARLVKKDINTDKITLIIDSICNTPLISQRDQENTRSIVVRELSNGDFEVAPLFTPEIKDHYRARAIHMKGIPD